jgi:ubiquinone/menaquinone biosynthesis C-methylase UbiE
MAEEITTTTAYKAAEVYERFIVASIFRYWTPLFIDRLTPKPGERVLDVACGTGVVARAIVPLVKPNGKVVGLDMNPAMLEVACRQFSQFCNDIDWREGTAESLPFPDQSFNLITCQQGLQFFKSRTAAAREMRRVLRKNGRVGIEVWQGLDKHPFYHTFFEAVADVFHVPAAEAASPFSFGDPQTLANLLEDGGFQQVQVEVVSQEARFSEPGQFAELMVRGASAVIPALRTADDSAQAEMFDTLKAKVAGLIQEHTINGALVVPLYANIATAYR